MDAAETALAEMGVVDASCVLGVVTDNPSVMKAFRRLFVEKHTWVIPLACWAHGLNTLVGEICRHAPAKAAIMRANRIVTFFNNSHYWGGQLKNTAKAEKVTRGLKKNCESRWYALILLVMSISAHQTPLSLLVAHPNARRPSDGYSAVNEDVIDIIQDRDFWPWISRVIRIAHPFVDVIAVCESRRANLADCMLNLLGAARQLLTLDKKDDDTIEFRTFEKHARAVVNKCFRQMATPVHRLALFLHPLCRKMAVVEDTPGYTLRDYKKTTLEIAVKWGWEDREAALLASDITTYGACKAPWEGGDRDAGGWWASLSISVKKHPLKAFACAILSLTPHSAEIERLFSACNGIQSPKRNSLAVETFSKLAKVRSSLVEEAKRRAPLRKKPATETAAPPPAATASGSALATRVTTDNSTPLERDEVLTRWQAPLEGPDPEEDSISGVEAVFKHLEATLALESVSVRGRRRQRTSGQFGRQAA
ncbi:DUF659 domain-containing protein [Mycena indigotica]|uniref:DUF659 domain-containing protein n=1 Tax=Mycena indigotica TaxID=2126181 RepID=A0A8H6S480_9AGAR|nr:DUF659 domain-containing protein [Mycena indigotica]KAF7292132.1 DUF659 domain-containing protein [Mycena indigotica]